MRGKSHLSLGHYLLARYMPDLPLPYQKAFLFGCIQPDRNPATYLKGSIRCQWLRGHNYHNASRFMKRIALRLERKKDKKMYDYYTLGKLIHYTADAFTYAHNISFSEKLSDHRAYEVQLQHRFLEYLREDPQVSVYTAGSVMDCIEQCHREYICETAHLHRDIRFSLQACCCVFAILMTPSMV